MNHPASSFAVAIRLERGEVVLAARGEIDVLTAPELRALLDALLDRGHERLVLDLAGVDFLDAAALRVITHAAKRLLVSGRPLTLRSPSPWMLRILAITGVDELVAFEGVGEGEGEGEGGEPTTAPAGDASRPGTEVAPAADLAARSLELVLGLAVAVVDGGASASVTRSDRGRLSTVASTDGSGLELDRVQYATGGGPCVASATQGRRFAIDVSGSDRRWPEFTAKARELDVARAVSAPLLVQGRPVGSFNLYRRAATDRYADEDELVDLFAGHAALAFGPRADVRPRLDVERLRAALASRDLVARAEGAVMARSGVSAADAGSMLRRSSRDSGVPLQVVAFDVLAELPGGGGPDVGV